MTLDEYLSGIELKEDGPMDGLLTYRQVAAAMAERGDKMSASQVHNIEKRALKKLRKALEGVK